MEHRHCVNADFQRLQAPAYRRRPILPLAGCPSDDISSSNELLDKSILESSDDLCPLEAVSKAVASSNVMKDSPRTHSRSNSHDSYFERKLQRQLKNGSNASEEKTREKNTLLLIMANR